MRYLNNICKSLSHNLAWLVTGLVIVGSIWLVSCKNTPDEPIPDNYQLQITTGTGGTQFNKGDNITFNVTLTNNGQPATGKKIGVYDDLSYLCAAMTLTDANGQTHYQVTGTRAGGFSFIFFSTEYDAKASYAIFIKETDIDSVNKPMTKYHFALATGQDANITKGNISAYSLDLAGNSIKDAALNPISVGGVLICLGSIASDLIIPIPDELLICPTALGVSASAFERGLLPSIVSNALAKVPDNDPNKPTAMLAFQGAQMEDVVFTIGDALLQSPKGGKSILAYDVDSWQGRNAQAKAAERLTDMLDAIQGATGVLVYQLQKISDEAFAMYIRIPAAVVMGQGSKYDEERLITIGFYGKPKPPVITLLDDQFNSFTGWTYTVDSNPGASFHTSNGLLSVANYGTQQSAYYGPMAVKPLSQSIDINGDDFTLSAWLLSNDGQTNKTGHVHIMLVDDDNVPIIGMYWYKSCGALHCDFYLGLYSQDALVNGPQYTTISGKVTLQKSMGQLTLHFNDGPALVTRTINSTRIATKLKLDILKWDGQTARDMQIDWIRLTKP